ncbi:MAG: SEC-C domain-containing protein [Planctomycetes bacterium]|nr:SEC-C domain-containing protein [Planctomycetota bacterium]
MTTSDDDAPRRSVARLTKVHGGKLPRAIRVEVLAHGPRAVPPLLDLLAGGPPLAAAHAATLLGALRAPEAIGPLLAALPDNDGAAAGLAAMGTLALEPVLEALGRAGAQPERERLLNVLAGAGVRDERIAAALVLALERAPRTTASIAARYGDPQVIDRLEAMFHATTPTDQDTAEQVIEMGVALVAAGRFGDAHLDTMNAAYEALGQALKALRGGDDPVDDDEEDVDDEGDADAPAPGRNEPCWCGSGKKFKRCCHGA